MSLPVSRVMGRLVGLVHNNCGHIDLDQVHLASDILKNGGVIAFPTDTLYGLAVKASNSQALDRIYSIKGRDSTKPLAVCVAQVNDVETVADTSNLYKPMILHALLPGPITLLLKRHRSLNPDLNPNISTVGVRVPDHNFVRAVCELTGPLALTSANRSGETSPIKADHFKDLWPQIDCIFDGGLTRDTQEDMFEKLDRELDENKLFSSTVVDLTEYRSYRIVREGRSLNRIKNILQRFGHSCKKTPTCHELVMQTP